MLGREIEENIVGKKTNNNIFELMKRTNLFNGEFIDRRSNIIHLHQISILLLFNPEIKSFYSIVSLKIIFIVLCR